MKILIVDDAEETRDVIKNIITVSIDESIVVIEAKNGREALDILKLNKIDILLTDIMMPEMDGFELIKRVKKEVTAPNTFVVAITGLTGDEQVKKLYASGADYYIPKPIQLEDLIVRLKLILRLLSKEKVVPVLIRQNFNPFLPTVMMNYYTVFVILQEDDLYKIIHHIVALFPQVNKIMLRDFMTILLKSYESLEEKFLAPFEITLESSHSDLFLSCSDFKYTEAIEENGISIPSEYEIIYMPQSMTIKIPAKG